MRRRSSAPPLLQCSSLPYLSKVVVGEVGFDLLAVFFCSFPESSIQVRSGCAVWFFLCFWGVSCPGCSSWACGWETHRCVYPLLDSPYRTWCRIAQPPYVRSGPDVWRHSIHCVGNCVVLRKHIFRPCHDGFDHWSCASSQKCVYTRVKSRESWSDWLSCMALNVCFKLATHFYLEQMEKPTKIHVCYQTGKICRVKKPDCYYNDATHRDYRMFNFLPIWSIKCFFYTSNNHVIMNRINSAGISM